MEQMFAHCRLEQCVDCVVVMQVPKTALKTPFQEGTVQDVAKKMLQLSRDGLARRGKHEEPFLDPLQEIADVCLPSTLTCHVVGVNALTALLLLFSVFKE